MGKGKKRTLLTVVTMAIVAGVILFLYSYFSGRPNLLKKEPSEVEIILGKDLKSNYPATPREVVKLISDVWKVLYTDLKDEEVDALAVKMRELYDKEFLDKNPQEKYMNNLYTEIASWREDKRTISNYLFVDEKQNEQKEVNGQQYATIHVSYTIKEKGKYAEKCKFILRKNDEGLWKILGWDFIKEE